MIGQKFNFDEVFFRDLTICVLDTLEGRLNWINRFTSGDIEVQVPIYYSLTGDERFLLDSFQDDIVSENRYVELNTDQIPRGHLTFNNFNIRSDEFRNPNVWLRSVVEDNLEVRKLLKQVRAIPITVTYDLGIILKTEIDVFKCAQEIMNTLWLYRFIYFEHNYMNIDAVLTMPDTDAIEIVREKNLKSDNTVKLTLSLEVQTYYPAFASTKDCKISTIFTPVCGVGDEFTSVVKVGPVFLKNCSGGKSVNSNLSEVGIGNLAIGDGVPSGTVVRSIDINNSEVTLSRSISCNIESSQITFIQDLSDFVQPYRTRWFNNLQPLTIKNSSSINPNANLNNPNFNSNQK
jgi:hypothetical protein